MIIDAQIAASLSEVPSEFCIVIQVKGCPHKCKGCHSPYLWSTKDGIELNKQSFDVILKKYQNYATCVLFMGGDWIADQLQPFLTQAKQTGYKTAMYAGVELPYVIGLLPSLDYIKVGSYKEELGGIETPGSNQKFFKCTNAQLEDLTYCFRENGFYVCKIK